MNTKYIATLWASPSFLFVFNEIPYSELSYILQIVNHTHGIPGSIAVIQVVQYVTRKAIATETILDSTFRYFLTVLDSARDAAFRFQTVVTLTTGACLPVSRIGTAKAAVHPTGRNQRRLHFIRQSFRHVRISAKSCKTLPFL